MFAEGFDVRYSHIFGTVSQRRRVSAFVDLGDSDIYRSAAAGEATL